MSDTECTYSADIECLPHVKDCGYSSVQGAWGSDLLDAHSLEGETDSEHIITQLII